MNKRAMKWWALNGTLFATLVAGYAFGIEGARNLTVFFVWWCFIRAFLMHSDIVQKALHEKGRMVPMLVSTGYDILYLLVLVWYGSIVLGFVWVLHMFVFEAAYQRAEKAKPELDGA
jgi:phosphatidylserine synthase